MEIEIKLGPLTPDRALAVFQDTGLLPPGGQCRQVRMETTYYDTPGGALAAQKQMLRLRREDGAPVCTFKSAPAGPARLELEVAADTLQEGARALAARPELPEDARKALAEGILVPTCGAAFTRSTRPCRREALTFDLCMDVGQLFAGSACEDLCEVELELTGGDPADLEALADELCTAYGLQRCPLSKQQRALALRCAP